MLYQRTLRHPVHAIGIGVHSGRKTAIRLMPAPAGTGIHFVRTDLPRAPSVPALASYVRDTHLSTSIGHRDVEVGSIEHLMSALHGLGIDNVRVEVSGSEVPVMDGSAAPFVDLIQSAGIAEQAAPRQFIRVTRKVSVTDAEGRASLRPYAGLKVGFAFAPQDSAPERYPRRCEFEHGRGDYVAAVSRARGFGRVDELDHARRQRKCRGSSLENSVGIDDLGVLNPEGLRYEDEFARHRVLDAIGDLYLLGRPLLGAFEGHGSSHALNVELIKSLLARHDAWQLITAAPTEAAALPEPQPAVLEARA
jgi:UDP-3-O-[3-hydroxymyristoyl] N-acetylglucosamine deacetylase